MTLDEIHAYKRFDGVLKPVVEAGAINQLIAYKMVAEALYRRAEDASRK